MSTDSRAYGFGVDRNYHRDRNDHRTFKDNQYSGEEGEKLRNSLQKFKRTASRIFNPQPSSERKAQPGYFDPTKSTLSNTTSDNPRYQAPIMMAMSETTGEWADMASEQIR